MSFTFTYNSSDQYLLFLHEGELNDESVSGFIDKGIQTVIDHACYKMINDYRQVDLNLSPSKLIEIHEIVINGFLDKGVDPHRVKRAIVASGLVNNLSYYQIFETINLNHGLTVKLFTDMDEAVQWIKAQ